MSAKFKAHANVECHERCVVRNVKTYIEQSLKGSLDNAFLFFLNPLQKFTKTGMLMFSFVLSQWVTTRSIAWLKG